MANGKFTHEAKPTIAEKTVLKKGSVPAEPAAPPAEEEDWEALLAGLGLEDPAPEPIPQEPAPVPPPEPEEEPDWDEEEEGFFSRYKLAILASMCAVAALLLAGMLWMIFHQEKKPGTPVIPQYVSAVGVSIGGMTQNEAENAIKAALNGRYETTPMEIHLGEEVITISPSAAVVRLDVHAMVMVAMHLTEPASLKAADYLIIDEEAIRAQLRTQAEQYLGAFQQSGWELKGTAPQLSETLCTPDTACQTLVITLGQPGKGMDVEEVLQKVLDAYAADTFLVELPAAEDDKLPDPLDWREILEAVTVEPADAYADPATHTLMPASYGYGISGDVLAATIAAASYGDVLELPLELTAPAVGMEALSFRDLLGSCETPHSNNENRNTNLRLACEALNGLVLQPGEVLSYNGTLGQRTADKGYQKAPAYSGYELVDSLGGGICQVSSTLYLASLLSDLEIVDRINHGYLSSYIDPGMDATVSWPKPDLKIRNNTPYPIRIEAKTDAEHVIVRIWGVDDRDYYVKMEYKETSTTYAEVTYREEKPDSGYTDGQILQAASTGHVIETYRCKYSKADNSLISRTLETKSVYPVVNAIVVKIIGGTPAATQPAATQPTTPATQPTEADSVG